MRIARYTQQDGSVQKIEYDDKAPCIICGEPVIGASMGGTVICGACDCGKCRYCGTTIMVLTEKYDPERRTKKQVLAHMEWHHKHTPEIVKKVNDSHIVMMDRLDKEAEERDKKESKK